MPEVVNRWMGEQNRTLPVVLIPPESGFNTYHGSSLPTVVAIDRAGKVIEQWIEFVSGPTIRRI